MILKKALKIIYSGKNFLMDVVFPKECVLCKKEGASLCLNCLTKYFKFTGFYCPFCRKRIPPSDEPKCSDYCFSKTHIKAVFSLSEYSDKSTKEAVRNFKFSGIYDIGRIFGEFISKNHLLAKLTAKNDFSAVCVPLHKKNLQKRGFNQSEILAIAISAGLGIPFLKNGIVKIKKTGHQVETKNKEERLKNLTGAFSVPDAKLVAGKNILLVDDIITTGATLAECAGELKKAGAKKIYGITIAR